ncbi:SDR family NAD(P)-dependent oxidoreductase [uncultured Streptomyces sp.]|uniref:SDR family NAD(P)-dependent oxidoreductase n=1 Tax=uncultured Streptomyces sp. TaxID=174707 RepID=UPI002612A908|nr:SDR family NAD(P)-dependent oxidoreductase [uncultured Streptomyces sp.]
MDRPVAVVTGATSGLGRVAVLELARRGYRVSAVARSRSKSEALVADLAAVTDEPVEVFHADLGLLSEARRVGEEIAARHARLDVLVNNAGLHAFAQRVTPEGLAEMTAVNYLGPFVLTRALTAKLGSCAPARIVNVASEASGRARTIAPAEDLRRTDPYNRRESMPLYGRTKLMTIMWTQELARRLDPHKVTVNCCDPGFNATGLGRDLPGSDVLRRVLNTLGIGDPRRGAGIIVRLATDPALDGMSGRYLSVRDARPLRCPEPGRDPRAQAELWEATEALLAERSAG